MILLDPRWFLNRLGGDLILIPLRTIGADASAFCGESEEEMELSATEKSERLAHTANFTFHSLRGLGPLMVVLAVTLSGCGDLSLIHI